MDHPQIEKTMLTGYPTKEHLDFEKEDHPIEDFSGTELQTGDRYFQIDDDIIYEENVEDYLIERLGARAYVAK